jgi:hypothetical protein
MSESNLRSGRKSLKLLPGEWVTFLGPASIEEVQALFKSVIGLELEETRLDYTDFGVIVSFSREMISHMCLWAFQESLLHGDAVQMGQRFRPRNQTPRED